jgi:hypothetical protein
MKWLILPATLLACFSKVFGETTPSSDYKPEKIFTDLRGMVLSTKPESIGIKIHTPDQVWGILMETGFPKAVVSLVALGDGTVSLYFSNGGGIIGLGPHKGPKLAAQRLLSCSEQFLGKASPTRSFPLPRKSYTRFYMLTGGRILTVEALEQDLGQGHHPLSALFFKGQDLITEVRKVDEQLRAAQASSNPIPN